jgi:hypothetical protein
MKISKDKTQTSEKFQTSNFQMSDYLNFDVWSLKFASEEGLA